MRRKLFGIFLIFLSLQLAGCGGYRDSLSLRADSFENADDRVEEDGTLRESGTECAEDSLDRSREDDTIFVHICGEISHPGVYEMKAGSRIYELVNQAGGLTMEASPSYLNQAQTLSDGQQIFVPSKEEAQGRMQADDAAMGRAPGGSSDARVNINTASREQLMTISGIGQSRANDILAYRESNGPFATVEEIMQVPGIKDGLFAKIKDRICVQ